MTIHHTQSRGQGSARTGTLLSVRGLTKTFPGQRALVDVDFELEAGTVRGLVGPNGSGKSTLVKILAGYHRPDGGVEASVQGAPFVLGSPDAASAAGMRFVQQDLGLVNEMSALDNLALGRGYRSGRSGAIDWKREVVEAERTLGELEYHIDVHAPVATLTASERTAIAIARALDEWAGAVSLLVLDEPTASMPAAEVKRLYDLVRTVRARGIGIIFVSHHFNEVFDITDDVTVLRDGRMIGTWPTSSLTEDRLVELTIGRPVDRVAHRRSAAAARSGAELLRLDGVSGSVARDVSFRVHPGEVVGVAGVTGSGREELAALVYGAASRGGEVRCSDTVVPVGRPDRSIEAGMALVPAQRATQAALRGMSSAENMTVSSLRPLYSWRGLHRGRERAAVLEAVVDLDVRPPDPEALFDTLSGGNQQKVVVARALRTDPSVLVLDEPTQGVDVGAQQVIHRRIRELAEAGAAALLVSSDSEELVSVCDRVLVMAKGVVAHERTTTGLDADTLTELTLRED